MEKIIIDFFIEIVLIFLALKFIAYPLIFKIINGMYNSEIEFLNKDDLEKNIKTFLFLKVYPIITLLTYIELIIKYHLKS